MTILNSVALDYILQHIDDIEADARAGNEDAKAVLNERLAYITTLKTAKQRELNMTEALYRYTHKEQKPDEQPASNE